MVPSVLSPSPSSLPVSTGASNPAAPVDPGEFAGVMREIAAVPEGGLPVESGVSTDAPLKPVQDLNAAVALLPMAAVSVWPTLSPVSPAPAPLSAVPVPVTATTAAATPAGAAVKPKFGGILEPLEDLDVQVEVFSIESIVGKSAETKDASSAVDAVIETAEDLTPEVDNLTEFHSGEDYKETSPDSSQKDPVLVVGNAERRPISAESSTRIESPRHEVRLDTHNVVRELANRIELMAATRQEQGVIVHLEPQDLGSITLLVKPDSGGVTAEIGATNDQVRQALAQSQTTLTRQLELRGVIVAQVSVSAETSNHNPQRQGESGYRPTFSGENRGMGHGFSDQQSSQTPVRVRAAGVDLWI